jgi:regulator of replication initiation timing
MSGKRYEFSTSGWRCHSPYIRIDEIDTNGNIDFNRTYHFSAEYIMEMSRELSSLRRDADNVTEENTAKVVETSNLRKKIEALESEKENMQAILNLFYKSGIFCSVWGEADEAWARAQAIKALTQVLQLQKENAELKKENSELKDIVEEERRHINAMSPTFEKCRGRNIDKIFREYDRREM